MSPDLQRRLIKVAQKLEKIQPVVKKAGKNEVNQAYAELDKALGSASQQLPDKQAEQIAVARQLLMNSWQAALKAMK
jgi:ABC-type transport system involved in cytochrome bd biosynthesis fused ATPase/permease subunit